MMTSAIRSSTRLALAQGPQAGMQHLRARLRHLILTVMVSIVRRLCDSRRSVRVFKIVNGEL